MDIGTCRASSGDGAADNPLVYFLQSLIIDSQLFRDAGPVILYNHVGLFNQPIKDLFPLGSLKIQSYALLAAIECPKIRLVTAQDPNRETDRRPWDFRP